MARPSTCLVAATVASVAVLLTSFSAPSIHANSQAGSITAATPMLEPRSGHSATLLQDGRVLVAGGMRRNQDFYRSAEIYDPVTGQFSRTGDMNVARVGQAAVLLRSGQVLIVGGWLGHGATDSAELYDPSTGKFQ